ncbi:UDP-N-acetylmuramoyl-L-alanyl-D-glutamate--2,6-diaminopimelate ligase [candidate division KSB1 bacterium]|nr:UDP-N-acetylmuramoyl-L-alanyl-D-glutamate--2,6-diaminopimelate ligase [candidate division KSB1 bacterium]
MPLLKSLLSGVEYNLLNGELNTPVNQIQVDSRNLKKGDLYIAIKGYRVDGHNFIAEAIKKGVECIILQDRTFKKFDQNITAIQLKNTRAGLPLIASNYNKNPADRLTLTGITGTNGKTTTAILIKSILEKHGKKTGLIGTIEYLIGQRNIGSGLTTPEPITLHHLFSHMVKNNVSHCVMEVTSHAIKQYRVDGLNFSHAIFTNITHDHLDYHGTIQNYFNTKAGLFENLNQNSLAIINYDNPFYDKLVKRTATDTILTYSLDESRTDIYAQKIDLFPDGSTIDIKTPDGDIFIKSKLPGLFNCENILAAVAFGIANNIDRDIIKQGIESVESIRGRFETVNFDQDYHIIIDYAHTPDALKKTLITITEQFGNDIITVLGCDGNRDRSKRALMGGIASEMSKLTVVTSDNPRNEDISSIIHDIKAGIIPGKKHKIIPDRKAAIEFALSKTKPGDTVLLAGKGHENYMEIKEKKFYFNEREIIKEYLKNHYHN